jgi:signal transduction histidine kinase
MLTDERLSPLPAEAGHNHLVADVQQLVDAGAAAKDALPLVEDYSAQVQETVAQIEKRFFYYSRVASLGLLAATIVHEVRNQCTVIGKLVSTLEKNKAEKAFVDHSLDRQLELTRMSIESLERLADKFAPLASRTPQRSKQSQILTTIRDCVDMREKEITSRHVDVAVKPMPEVNVRINPGELIAIVINFLDNALYWIAAVPKERRKIIFSIVALSAERVEVYVHDSGPGIEKGDEDRIFWPGVTRKPEGLGMGLTVASELISQHGGRTRLIVPGELGGASFAFDLPISNGAK